VPEPEHRAAGLSLRRLSAGEVPPRIGVVPCANRSRRASRDSLRVAGGRTWLGAAPQTSGRGGRWPPLPRRPHPPPPPSLLKPVPWLCCGVGDLDDPAETPTRPSPPGCGPPGGPDPPWPSAHGSRRARGWQAPAAGGPGSRPGGDGSPIPGFAASRRVYAGLESSPAVPSGGCRRGMPMNTHEMLELLTTPVWAGSGGWRPPGRGGPGRPGSGGCGPARRPAGTSGSYTGPENGRPKAWPAATWTRACSSARVTAAGRL